MVKEDRVASWISVVSFILVLVPAGIGIYWQWHKMTEEFNQPGYDLSLKKSSNVSADEQIEIDLWIKDNNLNKYGDSKGTVYLGGTPLFDEKTGQTISRYDYILKKHPDRPWHR